LLIVKRDQQD